MRAKVRAWPPGTGAAAPRVKYGDIPPPPMAAQELRGRPGGGEPDRRYMDRQAALYREREAELTARHPDEHIVVCGDEVFVGRTFGEAESRAHAAHPGMPLFSSMLHPPAGRGEDPAGSAGGQDTADAAFEEDAARQKRIFMDRADELLARYPEMFIAVCGGDVFVGRDDGEAISRAHAAHPGRPFFLRIHDPCPGC